VPNPGLKTLIDQRNVKKEACSYAEGVIDSYKLPASVSSINTNKPSVHPLGKI